MSGCVDLWFLGQVEQLVCVNGKISSGIMTVLQTALDLGQPEKRMRSRRTQLFVARGVFQITAR